MLRQAQATIFFIIAICLIAFAIYAGRPVTQIAQINIPAQTTADDRGVV